MNPLSNLTVFKTKLDSDYNFLTGNTRLTFIIWYRIGKSIPVYKYAIQFSPEFLNGHAIELSKIILEGLKKEILKHD
jgi:hypothetical protein